MASPDFSTLLARITAALGARGIPFMLIGGQAVLLHGRPRLTDDIDITLGAGPDRLPDVKAVSEALGLTLLPSDPGSFVESTNVLPVMDPGTGIRIDFLFSTTPYERQAIDRAVRVNLAGTAVPFASAEDLLIHKLFAGRPKDREDAEGIIRRKGATLDWVYLEHWLAMFAALPGREGLLKDLAQLREQESSE